MAAPTSVNCPHCGERTEIWIIESRNAEPERALLCDANSDNPFEIKLILNRISIRLFGGQRAIFQHCRELYSDKQVTQLTFQNTAEVTN